MATPCQVLAITLGTPWVELAKIEYLKPRQAKNT